MVVAGLYENIHAKRKRIAAGSKEKMRKPGAKGAPTAKAFKQAARTVKKKKILLSLKSLPTEDTATLPARQRRVYRRLAILHR